MLYDRERQALSAVSRALQSPAHIHLPLSFAHFAMYGLMCKWGYNLLAGASSATGPPKQD